MRNNGITLESLAEHKKQSVAEAKERGTCCEYIGYNPKVDRSGPIIKLTNEPLLLRCQNPPRPDDDICQYHHDLHVQGKTTCYTCGQPHTQGWHAWQAIPGRKYPDDYQDWLVVSVYDCCGAMASTEHVANFCGYLQDARKNAEEACRQHNAEHGQVHELMDAAEFLCHTLTEKTLSKLAENPEDVGEKVWGHVLKRLRLAVAKLATSKQEVSGEGPRSPLPTRGTRRRKGV